MQYFIGDHSTTLHMYVLQVDLVEVKKAFLDRYHKTLYKMIEGDTSGDYRRLLQGIVGSNVWIEKKEENVLWTF